MLRLPLLLKDSMQGAVLQETATTDCNTYITVSGDRTRNTKSHSSLIGACLVIGANAGTVIDMNVMSA